MPQIVAEELKEKLKELAKTLSYRAVFWSLAKRRRSLRETSVEAVYVSILKDFDQGAETAQKVNEEIKKLEELGMISGEQKTILTDVYARLEKESAQLAKKEDVVVTKESIITLFKTMQDMGIGRYIRSYDRNKKRFEWDLLSCIDVGKVALFPKYLVKIAAEPEPVVEMADGKICYIVSEEKKGKQWVKFLKRIKSWAEEQIQETDSL